MRGLLAVVVATLLGPLAMPPPAEQTKPIEAAAPTPARQVIVVGAAGLRWDDLDRARLPRLRELAADGSVGSLSVRSAPSITCPGEGWLTLGAGTYAAIDDPGSITPATGCAARPVPAVRARADGGALIADLPRIDRLNRGLRFGAEPGWLAGQVPCITAVGDGAALAAANADGTVGRYLPTVPGDPAQLGATFDACPVTVVDAGVLPRAVGPARTHALERLDDLVGRIDGARDPATVVMVLGLAETDGTLPRLHLAVAAGPGFDGGDLRSASTRRAPYVQLVDVAPTIVASLGREVPDTVAGRPFTGGHDAAGGAADRAGVESTAQRLSDADLLSVQQRKVLGPFFVGLAALVIAVCVGLVVTRSPRLRTLAVGLSAVPVATFLANLVPWWRAPWPLLALTAAVVAGAATILAVAVVAGHHHGHHGHGHGHHDSRPTCGPTSRQDVRVELGAVALVTVGVFVADALTGARLQMGSMLGYNPVVAGRFVGFGNIAFSVLAAATVILASLVAEGRPRRTALLATAVVTLPVVVVDGLPAWGADFGGVLTLVPTFTVLALLLGRIAVTWSRVLLAQVAGFVVVGGVAWLDYRRPPAARSHFGRFVGTALDGSAWHTIERKWLTSWDLLFAGPHTLAALALAVALVAVVLRPPALLREACGRHSALRPMLLTLVALAVIGGATNDSGVAVPAVISLVGVPGVLALCCTAASDDPAQPSLAPGGSGNAMRGAASSR